MTRAPNRAPLPVADVEHAAAAVRRRGGRLSAPRRRVLEALFAADGPVSAERIARGSAGGDGPIELTSVYRSLEHLEEIGVVRHVHLGHGPGLYALAGDADREYLVCERCDRIVAVDGAGLDPVRAHLRAAFGFRARFSHFPIVGTCAACAERERSGTLARDPRAHPHG